MQSNHETRGSRLLNNPAFHEILKKYDHEVLPMIGIASGWEEMAAHCDTIAWLKLGLFHPEFNTPDQFYCDNVIYDWRVEE